MCQGRRSINRIAGFSGCFGSSRGSGRKQLRVLADIEADARIDDFIVENRSVKDWERVAPERAAVLGGGIV